MVDWSTLEHAAQATLDPGPLDLGPARIGPRQARVQLAIPQQIPQQPMGLGIATVKAIATVSALVLTLASPSLAAPPAPSKPAAKPTPTAKPAAPTPAQSAGQQLSADQLKALPNPYDRYMNAGYAALRLKIYSQAYLYFQRALDERPADEFALKALQELQRQAGQILQPPLETAKPLDQTENQNWEGVTVNAVGDRFLVAPATIKSSPEDVGFWEFRAFSQPNDALLPTTLKTSVRSLMIFRSVNCANPATTRLRSLRAFDGQRQLLLNQSWTVPITEAPRLGSSSARVVQFVCAKVAQAKPS